MSRLRLLVLLSLVAAFVITAGPAFDAALAQGEPTEEPPPPTEVPTEAPPPTEAPTEAPPPTEAPTEESTQPPVETATSEVEETQEGKEQPTEPPLLMPTPDGATPAASPSPVTVPQMTAEECQQYAVWSAELGPRYEDVAIALAEAGVGAGSSEESVEQLDARTARRLARLIDRTVRREARHEVPDFAQPAEDAYREYIAAIGDFLNRYAEDIDAGMSGEEAIEANADPDAPFTTAMQAEIDALNQACDQPDAQYDETPEVTADDCLAVDVWFREGSERYGDAGVALAEFGLGSAPGTTTDPAMVSLDAAKARELASMIADFVEEQEDAEVPEAAEDASEAFLENHESIAEALNEYADALDDGEDPAVALDAFLVQYDELSVAAYNDLNGLLAACNMINPSTPESGS